MRTGSIIDAIERVTNYSSITTRPVGVTRTRLFSHRLEVPVMTSWDLTAASMRTGSIIDAIERVTNYSSITTRPVGVAIKTCYDTLYISLEWT